MTYITKESALQAITDYQGGAVDKTVAKQIIEGLPENVPNDYIDGFRAGSSYVLNELKKVFCANLENAVLYGAERRTDETD